MEEAFIKILSNINSGMYAANHGAGFVPWQSGCFIRNDFMPQTLEESRARAGNLFMPESIEALLYDSVAEADEAIFKMCDVDRW